MKTDVLVIGSGIAGLSFAIKMAERRPDMHISIFTKADAFETNTKYAQGGIAAVMNNDVYNVESHVHDTLIAGKGLCDSKTVRMVVEKAPERLNELIQWGTDFDKTPDGNWHYGLEGGHSTARILHHKDQTGKVLEKTLLKRLKSHKNIGLHTEYFALDLIVENNQCFGAYFFDRNQKQNIPVFAKATYLSTGGSGQVFEKTTNPEIATGDGVAMAYRAGAKISHMGYYQFHPTALATSQNSAAFLISEAVRGAGAYLINSQGHRFIFDYDGLGELATRDDVCHAIFSEMQKTNSSYVFLDARHLDKKTFKNHFPHIIKNCRLHGFDILNEPVPVAPAAHYQCGGIAVNNKSETSVKNLYVNGECAYTGLHGANRLASNSLLEAVVFAHEAACKVGKKLDAPHRYPNSITSVIITEEKSDSETISAQKKQLRKWMYDFYLQKILGKDTSAIRDKIDEMARQTDPKPQSVEACELANLLCVAQLIIRQ